jgi:hypothetical protein
MSTSRTAERPPSVAPAIANRRTSLSLAEVAPARQGGFGSSGSDPFCVKKTQPDSLGAAVVCIQTHDKFRLFCIQFQTQLMTSYYRNS